MKTQIVWRLSFNSNELNRPRLHIGSLGSLLLVGIENLISLRIFLKEYYLPFYLGTYKRNTVHAIFLNDNIYLYSRKDG